MYRFVSTASSILILRSARASVAADACVLHPRVQSKTGGTCGNLEGPRLQSLLDLLSLSPRSSLPASFMLRAVGHTERGRGERQHPLDVIPNGEDLSSRGIVWPRLLGVTL
jgi:hypothetical protein